jgi:hypothetical protein
MDRELFDRLLTELGIGLSVAEANSEFASIDESGDGFIDMYEFEAWMKRKTREDARYVRGLRRIGHRGGRAKIKLPHVKPRDLESRQGRPATRAQKFLQARHKKLKSSHVYWLEVTGSLMSVYDSEDKATEPLARLQLSDPEVERVDIGKRRSEGWDDSPGSASAHFGGLDAAWKDGSNRSVCFFPQSVRNLFLCFLSARTRTRTRTRKRKRKLLLKYQERLGSSTRKLSNARGYSRCDALTVL